MWHRVQTNMTGHLSSQQVKRESSYCEHSRHLPMVSISRMLTLAAVDMMVLGAASAAAGAEAGRSGLLMARSRTSLGTIAVPLPPLGLLRRAGNDGSSVSFGEAHTFIKGTLHDTDDVTGSTCT